MGRSYLSKKLKDVSSSGWIFVHAGVGDLVYKKKKLGEEEEVEEESS